MFAVKKAGDMDKLFSLQDKTILITGGATGLGKHFAQLFSEQGAHVIVCARRVEKLREVVAEIQERGGIASYHALDVTDAAQVEAVFSDIYAQLDGACVDVLVNNAGVVGEPMLLDLEESEWDSVLDTNLKGAWLLAKEFARRLLVTQQAGSIINIASILGLCAQKGTGPYAASKAALIHLTRNMALEWARYQIRVNAVLPGYYATDLAEGFLQSDVGQAMVKRIPQRRLGNVEDLSGAMLLLASDASRYMTGSTITVDGGQSIPQTL